MLKKKYFFFILALIVLAGPAWAQRLTDDRELFMGVTGTNKIKPNLMVLMDNSGSMQTVIFHPSYNPNTILSEARPGDTDGIFNWNDLRLNVIKTFYINRGRINYRCEYDSYAQWDSTISSSPTRKWKVYYSNPDEYYYPTPPAIGQVISFLCNVSNSVCSCNYTATISNVAQKTEGSGSRRRYYYEITVTGTSANPNSTYPYLYLNVHKVIDTTDNSVSFSETADSNYEESIPITLYGSTQEGYSGNRYDLNYLKWLAYYATETQINEVSAWASGANQGKFPDENGVLQEAGLVRIRVARSTLQNLADDVHEDCRLGLTIFSSSNDGGSQLYSISDSFDLASFKSTIGGVAAETWTPLAEALADIWKYFKGGGSYMPNTAKYTSGTASTMLAATPIQPYCRNSYVIIITDGQSTQDQFTDYKYNYSVFKTSAKAPMVLNSTTGVCTSGWGDLDANDPTLSSSSRTYCPGLTCWDTNGSDYLDDVAYLMYNYDLFPETNPSFADMIGKQTISTYVVGLTMDNMMLAETARNGGGQYYTASNATQLKSALTSIINNINLRDFAFAAFTAPKRVTTNVGEGASYVGYFMPSAELSADSPFWLGHLQSFKVTDVWCPDFENDGLDGDDCATKYETEFECQSANPRSETYPNLTCKRTIEMADKETWDAAPLLSERTAARNLYSNNDTTPVAFTLANRDSLQTLGLTVNDTSANYIITTMNNGTTALGKILGDIFHSDIAYVGPPLIGKKYLSSLNPSDCGTTSGLDKTEDARCYEKLFTDKAARRKVLYTGSNDGVLHQIDALTGEELWGFIPDAILPSLTGILVDRDYTFTVDGRMSAEDIYYRGASNVWKTILAFGLRHGGNAYYALDITSVESQPNVLWKFEDGTYSGESWDKPIIGKINYYDTIAGKNIDRWVVVVAAGFAFNNENPNDLKGKAVFVIDASSGELVWMIGYDPTNGVDDDTNTVAIDTAVSGVRLLTRKPEFNYSIPSGLTAVDRDNNGYLDTIYFGNVAGHLFKTDISKVTPGDWKTYQLFKHVLTDSASATISNVSGAIVRVNSVANYTEDQSVIGSVSHAMGVIGNVDSANNELTIQATPSSGGPGFLNGEQVLVRSFDPIFLPPAVAFDKCANLWVTFGTGDRTRSRTNPTYGKLVSLRDGTTTVNDEAVQKNDILIGDLVALSWTDNTLNATSIKVANKWGWYFTFPDSAQYEKLFDPDPVILPDEYLRSHIYFNTYQRPPDTASASDDCNAPEDSTMTFYDICLDYCGDGTVAGVKEAGRFAGGGMFKDYTIIQGTAELASIPPAQRIMNIKLTYTGGLLFWKEKKR